MAVGVVGMGYSSYKGEESGTRHTLRTEVDQVRVIPRVADPTHISSLSEVSSQVKATKSRFPCCNVWGPLE